MDKIIIAGPCAAESREQVIKSALEAKKRGLKIVRASLWKPRTKPGFEGIGEAGIPFLASIAQMGLIPATEILLPEQAQAVIYGVISKVPNAQLLLWLGARNQNHFLQQEIGRVVSRYKQVTLMIKNQLWENDDHWIGIINHVRVGGVSDAQILLCHRGFAPSTTEFRNPPNYQVAMRVKCATKLPMIVDPSHIAGYSSENVLRLTRTAFEKRSVINGDLPVRFDGMIVEVHPDPTVARTDADQQLTWEQFDSLKTFL